MQSFKDCEGRTWPVVITVALAKKVRLETGVDVYRLADDGLKPLGNLLADAILLIDVLYILVRAGDKSVTPEQFGEAISGDVIEAAANAFCEALADFFPDREKRALLRNVLEKGRKLERLLREKGTKDLAGIDPEKIAREMVERVELQQKAQEARERAERKALLAEIEKAPPNGSSGPAPASAESTPTTVPSAS